MNFYTVALLCGVVVACWTGDREVAGSAFAWCTAR